MPELTESPRAQAWREFMDTKCPVCGGAKREKNGFCSRCYFSLPKDMQKSLWQGFGHGYEESHEECRDWLNQERRAKT
jgi:predicted nucleic acid-binding Zn ribbon protein